MLDSVTVFFLHCGYTVTADSLLCLLFKSYLNSYPLMHWISYFMHRNREILIIRTVFVSQAVLRRDAFPLVVYNLKCLSQSVTLSAADLPNNVTTMPTCRLCFRLFL